MTIDDAEAAVAIADAALHMTIRTQGTKVQSRRTIASRPDLCEGTVRHHIRRFAAALGDVEFVPVGPLIAPPGQRYEEPEQVARYAGARTAAVTVRYHMFCGA